VTPSSAAPARPVSEAGRCLYCGEPLQRGQVTCRSCGEPVVQGERKLVSVLFADLTGYTALAGSLDPEDVYTFIRPAMTALRLRVEAFGGSVPQILGDGFMAVFGVPTAHEDDAERAVRAALDVVRHVHEMNAGRSGLKLPEVHAGVNTGEVLVAGSREASGFAVVGDIVNVASRLADLAPGGHVLVGERTREMTAHAIRYGEPVRRKMKGKRAPLPVYEALDALSPIPAGHVAPPRTTRFVGREHLLRRLRSELKDAARQGSSRVTLVVGDPGLGKSRLALEFLRESAQAIPLYGRCPPYGQTLPYFALAEAVRDHAGIASDTEPAEVDSAIRGLARRSSAARSWRSAAAHLRLLLGLDTRPVSSGPASPEEGRTAARAVLEGLARRGPVLVVLDDVHWADQDLLRLLEDVAASPCTGPILILALARSELATHMAEVKAIELKALDDRDAGAILELTLGPNLPEALVSRIVARSAGNPLYLEESARMLVESGVLVRSDGTWTVADPEGIERVPETLRLLIAARMDSLTPDEKKVLQDASVSGEVTWDSLLERMARGTDPRRALRSLERRHLLLRRGRSSIPGATEFEFKHVLIMDVAYQSLPRAERASRHLLAAQWLQERAERADEEPVAALAHHYEQAWALSKSRGGWTALATTAQLAAGYLKRAGDQAFAFQPRLGHALYRRGLRIAREAGDAVGPAMIADLEVGAAETAIELGSHREAIETAGEALDAADLAGRKDLRAQSLLALGRAHSYLGELERARALLREALGLFEATHDVRGQAWTVYRLSEAWRFDDHPLQVDLLRDAHRWFEAAGERWGEAMAAQELAYLLTLTGGTEFRESYELARVASDREGGLRSKAALTRIWGYSAYYGGEYAEAIRAAREARPLAAEAGDRWVEVDTLLLESLVAAAAGSPQDGERLSSQVVAIAQEAGTRHLKALALLAGARSAVRAGRVALGRQRLRSARRTLQALRVEAEMAEVDLVEAALLLDLGSWPRAALLAEAGAARAEGNGWRMFAAQGLVLRGRANLGAGRYEQAHTALQAAVELSEAAGASGWLAVARAALGQASILLGERPAPRRARPASPEAEAIQAENEGLLALRATDVLSAADHFAVAVAHWGRLGLTASLARALGWRADALRQARMGREASASLKRAEETLRRLGSPARGRGGVWHPIPSGTR
jgi:class 3 adenylate cyclase/tetratricopeptide (TPR) repeat protein